MDLFRIVGMASALSICWLGQTYCQHRYLHDSPPRANVADVGNLNYHGQSIEYALPSAEQIESADLSLPFVTAKQHDIDMAHFRQNHIAYGVLALLFAVGTFIVGCRLGEDWRYGMACILVGPLVVSYTVYRTIMADRRTRL